MLGSDFMWTVSEIKKTMYLKLHSGKFRRYSKYSYAVSSWTHSTQTLNSRKVWFFFFLSSVYQRACTGDFLQYWYLLSFFHCYLEGALFRRVNGVTTVYQWGNWCLSFGQLRPAGCFCWIQIIDFPVSKKDIPPFTLSKPLLPVCVGTCWVWSKITQLLCLLYRCLWPFLIQTRVSETNNPVFI